MKIQLAPSRHCRDARVGGHRTTAMHDMSTPLPMHGVIEESEQFGVALAVTSDGYMHRTAHEIDRDLEHLDLNLTL